MSSVIGTVRGSTIELDSPLPALEGKRVRVDAERAAFAECRAGKTQWVPSADVRAKINARLHQK